VGSNGNYGSGNDVTISGNDARLQRLEYDFQQDINGDGQALPVTQIEAVGQTRLVQVGDTYALVRGNGVSPRLTYNGTIVTDGQFDGWTPIAAETPTSVYYYVVWKHELTDQYKIWMTDAHGNMQHDYGVMAGADWMLRTVEATVKQDINNDGMIGLPDSPYDISLNVYGDDIYDLYFEAAARRWEQVITADLPSVNNSTYGLIDDLRIDVRIQYVDGQGNALAGAAPVYLRSGSNLTSYGTLDVDMYDIASMIAAGTLFQTALHEMGHILGIGSLWSLFELAEGAEYYGVNALDAYRALSGDASATFIPLETSGVTGTIGKHWSEDVFGNELMTGFMTGLPNPLSILTIAALRDLGYSVDYSQAEAYTLPA